MDFHEVRLSFAKVKKLLGSAWVRDRGEKSRSKGGREGESKREKEEAIFYSCHWKCTCLLFITSP